MKCLKKEEWRNDFVRNLSGMMNEENISQTELAKRSNLSKETINKYLNHQRYPSAIAVVNLAQALNCDVEDLIWTYGLVE